MSDVQIYNLFAGLTVVFVLFGGLGVYAFRAQAAEVIREKARRERDRLRQKVMRCSMRKGRKL